MKPYSIFRRAGPLICIALLTACSAIIPAVEEEVVETIVNEIDRHVEAAKTE